MYGNFVFIPVIIIQSRPSHYISSKHALQYSPSSTRSFKLLSFLQASKPSMYVPCSSHVLHTRPTSAPFIWLDLHTCIHLHTYIFYPACTMASSSFGAIDFNVSNVIVTYVVGLKRGRTRTGSRGQGHGRCGGEWGIFIMTTVRPAAILDYLYAICQCECSGQGMG